MSHRRATWQRSHRQCSWVTHHAVAYPIGSHCGSGGTAYGGLPTCPPCGGARLVCSAWQVGSWGPQSPIARPSDPMDISCETGLLATYSRTPPLMEYALTI